MKTNGHVFTGKDDLDTLVRIWQTLLLILHNVDCDHLLSSFELTIINAAAAVVDVIKNKHHL
jgi:hypothetical protein